LEKGVTTRNVPESWLHRFPLCMAACSLAVSVRIIPEVEIIQAGIT